MNAIDLVFTVALMQELPVEWLREQGVAVHRLAALRSGALKSRSDSATGILVVVTGVGPEASQDAAVWIRDQIKPRFVVNLGTAGALAASGDTQKWITPERVESESGEPIAIDTRLPFPFPDSMKRRVGGTLLSVQQARPQAPPHEWSSSDYVDMECHAQAVVFDEAGIAFHVLKWVSDAPGPQAEQVFQEALQVFRSAVKDLLGFVVSGDKPDITVVIPVHNRVGRIAACIDSVLDQTLPVAEVIVVDDGCDDGTDEVLARYANRINVVCLEKNRGVSAARNAGVAAATGKWIAFLDSDDQWTPDKLERQWVFHRANPHYQVLQCEEIWIRNGVRVNPHNHHAKPAGWIWSPSLRRCLVSPSGIVLRKALFEALGGFDESLPACEDYDLWVRLARHHVVGLAPHAGVVKHGGHDDQLSRRYPAMDRFRVAALRKALLEETASAYRNQLVEMMHEKLNILIQGARKRSLTDDLRYYETLLAELPAGVAPSNVER